MWGNVPDDWNMYYRKCMDCGGTYHESEGGCGCYEVRREEAWHNIVDRLRHCMIDEVDYENVLFSGEDDLGDHLSKGGRQVRLYITEPDEGVDELIFSLDNWAELKPVIGYVEEEDE